MQEDRADVTVDPNYLPQLSAEVPPLPRYVGELSPHSDLTYRLLEGLNIAGTNLHLSLFSGSILRNCTFRFVDFSRSDMDGMRIENCSFLDCNMEAVEFRSTTISYCKFHNTPLDGNTFLDCTLSHCSLVNSPMQNTSVTQSVFLSCEVDSCSLTKSSITLCTFKQVVFRRMLLGDCTFTYNILKGCNFIDSGMDIESVGSAFGLESQNISELKLIHNGEPQPVPPEESIVGLLIAFYQTRQWHHALLVMRLNFQLTSVVWAVREYFGWLFKGLKEGRLLKTDELRFVTNIFYELRAERMLPLLNVIECIELTNGILWNSPQHSNDPRTRLAVMQFSNDLGMFLAEMLDELDNAHSNLFQYTEDVVVEAHGVFHHSPEMPLAALLTECGTKSGLMIAAPSRTLRTKSGSYYEFVETTIYSVIALRVLLFLLTGCVIRATELKVHLENFLNVPATYRRKILESRQEVSPLVLKPLRNLLGSVATLPWLQDKALNGYGSDNFREIEVADERKRRGRRSPKG